jgi:hypothetical protein
MAWARQSGQAPIYRTARHRKARAALLQAFRPGDPCCICQQPMYPPTSALHADHVPGTDTYRGLAHADCNREDGAQRARQRRSGQTPATGLRW